VFCQVGQNQLVHLVDKHAATSRQRPVLSHIKPSTAHAVRENIRELVEQAAEYSGAADEDLVSRRIAEQEAELDLLLKRRDKLSQSNS
jgi:hypothetical protein